MNLFNRCILTFSLILVCCTSFSTEISLEEELTITQSQKSTLDTFRKIMTPRLPHSYMKEDIYLIKWLRARNFNLKQAEELLMQNLKWRADNKMDTIHEEDWSDLIQDYPYSIDTVDKLGQPVIIGNIGEWDLRRVVMTGRVPRILRYLNKIIDEATVKIRGLQEQGLNVTRFLFIEDLNSFNAAQHICPACSVGFIQFLQSFETHYPEYADKIILINVPPIFEVALRITRSQLGPQTQQLMHIFGRNRQQWEKFVLSYIDKSQLTPAYGGTRKS